MKLNAPNTDKKIIIAGPCSAESEQQVLQTAHALASMKLDYFRAGVWKPRTKPGCFEGIGELALNWLVKARQETGLPIATEIANASHAEAALRYQLDAIWIGARTTTNPFAVQEIAEALKGSSIKVFVKNPVNPDIELWIGAIERLQKVGIQHIGAIHRGFSSYGQNIYRNAPQWHIPLELQRRYPELPIICDPSHIGGKANLIETLAQEALDMQFDGLMIETHPHPLDAWSDAKQQITPSEFKQIIEHLIIRKKSSKNTAIDSLRQEIDTQDQLIIEALAKRFAITNHIGSLKKESNLPVFQPNRYTELLEKEIKLAHSMGVDSTFMKKIIETIHEESVRIQSQIMNNHDAK